MLMQLELKRCARCKRKFFRIDSPVCEACMPAEEEEFARIRDIIIHSPHANADKVAEQARVNLACVMRMIEAERLAHKLTTRKIRCGRCNRPALSASKRLCEECLTTLEHQVVQAMHSLRPRFLEMRFGTSMNDVHLIYQQKRRR